MEQQNTPVIPKEKFRTSVGGQALMEGVMMRGPKRLCCAVRRPDGGIETDIKELPPKKWYEKVPFVRGVFAMIGSMITGYRCLMYSADIAMQDSEDSEPESKLDKWLDEHLGEKFQNALMVCAALMGGVAAILLFSVTPTSVVGFVSRFMPLGRWGRVVLEAVLKMAIFLAYLALCSRMKEIHRLFEYHGAEHKTIACYEAGEPLTVENIRKYSRFHPRCGTSFLILTLLVSIAVFSVIPWTGTALRVVYKLLFLPMVMGISYELLKLCGRTDNLLTHIIRAPGLWVQRLTVFEPDDSMIECAIQAVTPVLPENPEEGQW
ncbi:MAG: DUF1385 domain-containing protein [Subdoligranulum sp.]|nr:DUF1385 domain-containing protein [Subdoligranulum sp.]MDD7265107.1 DUF1385 domain-containing protein [Subdoligranulum sp.]